VRLEALRLPPDLPVSLPSQLVEQRPDVRSAEEQLHQASAQIGVAVAARLPSFNLTGQYGAVAPIPAQLFTPATIIWTLAASGAQPIFHGGTLLHQERAARAFYDQAEAQYRNTVLAAFQNAFGGGDDEINYVDFEVSEHADELFRRTVIRRGGDVQHASEMTAIQRV